jgi:hypothetical protein
MSVIDSDSNCLQRDLLLAQIATNEKRETGRFRVRHWIKLN